MRVTTILLTSLCASVVVAQQGDSQEVVQARSHVENGERFFEASDFASAYVEFDAALTLMRRMQPPHPNTHLVVWNLAQTAMSMNRERTALQLYREYVSTAPAGAPHRDDAMREINELELRVRMDAQSSGWSPSPLGLVVGAVGAAMLIGGGIAGGIALATHNDAIGMCVGIHCTQTGYSRLADAQTIGIAADVLLWGGLATFVVGVILALVIADQPRPTVTAWVNGNGAGLLAVGVW